MATSIDIRELPERFRELVAQAGTGVEVIVTEGGVPRDRLLPLPATTTRVAGLNAGSIQISDDFDNPLPDDFWARRS